MIKGLLAKRGQGQIYPPYFPLTYGGASHCTVSVSDMYMYMYIQYKLQTSCEHEDISALRMSHHYILYTQYCVFTVRGMHCVLHSAHMHACGGGRQRPVSPSNWTATLAWISCLLCKYCLLDRLPCTPAKSWRARD